MLTEKENADLRVRCLEIMTYNASRHDITRGECIRLAQEAFEWVAPKTTVAAVSENPRSAARK